MISLTFLVSINSASPDYFPYLKYFLNSPKLFDSGFIAYSRFTHTEIGYDVFQAFMKIITRSAIIFFFVLCLISLCFRYRFYKYFCPNIQDISIIFFAFFAHEFLRKDCIQIRNGIASAIALYSLIFLYKNRKLYFIILILFAASFQQTALVAIPLLVVHTKMTYKYNRMLKLIFIISILLSLILPLKTILELLHSFGFLPDVIYHYLHYSQFSQTMSLTNPQLAKQILITGYFLFFLNKKYKNDETVFFLFQVYLLCTIYYLLFRDFEILAGRFGSLLYGVEPVLLLRIIQLKGNKQVTLKLMMCGFYFVFFAINIYTKAIGWESVLL